MWWYKLCMSRTEQQPSPPLSLCDLNGETCSVEQAARVLSIGRGLAYELARSGELPGVLRLGHKFRVSVPALRAALGVRGDGGPA